MEFSMARCAFFNFAPETIFIALVILRVDETDFILLLISFNDSINVSFVFAG